MVYLVIKSKDKSHITRMYNENTRICDLRGLVRSFSVINNCDLDEIKIEYDGQIIDYRSIQTKRGLSTKIISVKEIFKRGGKIFD